MQRETYELNTCSSMTEYVQENEFPPGSVVKFFNSQNKKGFTIRWKKRKKVQFTEQNLSEQIQNHYQQYGCLQQINDYNGLNKFIHDKFKKDNYNLKCDLIRPRLETISSNQGKCKTIGEYFLQFGLDVYIKFLKTKLPRTKKKKTKKEKKQKKSAIGCLIESLNAAIGHKKSKPTAVFVNAYYNNKFNCKQIIKDYNLFYDFYQKSYNDPKTIEKHKKISKCDFFIRLPSD